MQEQQKNSSRGKYKRPWETKPYRIGFTTSTRQAEQIQALIKAKGFTRTALIRYAIDKYLGEAA
jgi:type IV secretory pathway component VirB8